MKSPMDALQPLGRALMLPIAVLPLAGLLLRLGQPDLLNIGFLAAAGDAIFSNLGLIFALGVGVGFAKDNNGAAALAGVVCFLVATAAAKSLVVPPAAVLGGGTQESRDLLSEAFRTKALAKLSVPLGILSGVIAGGFYNRFSTLALPEYLAFFGGRRFVPIISGMAGVGVGLVFGGGWSVLSDAMDGLSQAIVRSGPVGLFAYGFLNRLLIVTGLHHILNNVVWFLLGDYHGATGDLKRFFAGDPTAGAFMAGYFPVMMFGLPAACLAMYRSARPERRAAVGGMLLSLALTAALTGVTEPIEFSFMFLAPALFLAHAVLTGLSMVLMDSLGVKLGFGFSAGLFDYVLNFGRSTRPLLLPLVGLAYGALYYGVFRLFIVRFDLKTPGRESEAEAGAGKAWRGSDGDAGQRARAFVEALGGPANLKDVAACTTRLRLVVDSGAAVDEAALRRLGAKGVIRPSSTTLQVVLGPEADIVAGEIRGALSPDLVAPAPPGPASAPAERAARLLGALGGPGNVLSVATSVSRLRLALARSEAVDEPMLLTLGVRGLVWPSNGSLHIITGPGAEDLAGALRALLP